MVPSPSLHPLTGEKLTLAVHYSQILQASSSKNKGQPLKGYPLFLLEPGKIIELSTYWLRRPNTRTRNFRTLWQQPKLLPYFLPRES